MSYFSISFEIWVQVNEMRLDCRIDKAAYGGTSHAPSATGHASKHLQALEHHRISMQIKQRHRTWIVTMLLCTRMAYSSHH